MELKKKGRDINRKIGRNCKRGIRREKVINEEECKNWMTEGRIFRWKRMKYGKTGKVFGTEGKELDGLKGY